jgi:SAM-dependent methyltransferase
MARPRIFVSWSGALGRRVAECLASTFLSHADLDPWVATYDVALGKPWFDEHLRQLKAADHGICCLTPGISERPWLLFEAGALFTHLDRCFVVRVSTGPGAVREGGSGPLAHLQSTDGRDRQAMAELLGQLTRMNDDDVTEWVARHWPAWQRAIAEIDHDVLSPRGDVYDLMNQVRHTAEEVMGRREISDNGCLRRIVATSLASVNRQVRNADTSYLMPAAEYADMLITLQREDKAHVRAIALLERDEHFWLQRAGRQIANTARPNSHRVFVFTHGKQVEQYFETLMRHADRYCVSAISLDCLHREFSGFDKDFSIITTEAGAVMADYVDDDISPRKMIRFVSASQGIVRHEEAISSIIRRAVRIDPAQRPTPDALTDQLFGRGLTALDHRPIEMSKYIVVDEYDLHEEKHAYYVEMMDDMVARIAAERRRAWGRIRILEMGAGTGIFTKRLATIPDADIVALEIDWHCYQVLRRNMAPFPNVVVENRDSRVYNPDGHFHFVVSSFADHHIKPDDKPNYFANVQQNLIEDGRFVVGDEFLPVHDERNLEARSKALHAYHEHIINIALQAGHQELARLEESALRSGLEDVGDFKVTCQRYEDMLAVAGLGVTNVKKIGPLGQDDVGGVFVYVMRSRRRA